MGKWGGQAVATFFDWRSNTPYDQNGTDANPQFTDAAHHNYLLAPGSAAIDRGDPTASYINEPGNNGGRINLGFEGNSAQATQSPSQVVQVLSPNGLDKLEQGQPATITWQSSGSRGRERDRRLQQPAATPCRARTNWSTWTADPGANYTSEGATVNTAGSRVRGPGRGLCGLEERRERRRQRAQGGRAGGGRHLYGPSRLCAEYPDLGSTPRQRLRALVRHQDQRRRWSRRTSTPMRRPATASTRPW